MDRTCAGIVSYNPNIERLKLNISAICEQVSEVFIVDNGSENIANIRNLIIEFTNVNLISNIENAGIAKALNQLCEIANANHYRWILTLDQDTVCPSDIIEKLSRYTAREDVGLICPSVKYEGWELDDSLDEGTSEFEEVFACMTSGSLTRIAAWKKVDGFREEYFIDFVDNEFCMKLRLSDYKIIRVKTCYMRHQLGDSGTISVFNILRIKYARHAPWRYYYMVRNNRAFIEEYKEFLPILKEYLKLWYIITKGVIFSRNKRKTLYFVYIGYKDGRAHRLGRLKGEF